MVKTVIFDLNGVLIKSEFLSTRLNKEFGVPEEEVVAALKDVMPKIRKPGAGDAFYYWEPYLRKWGLSLTREKFFSFWFKGESLVPEIVELVKKLRDKGIKVFILSNNFAERTNYYRKNFPEIFSSLNEFDAVYFSWETGFVKPDDRAYKKILQDHSLKPEECVYFDDSKLNVEVARKLGMDAHKFESIKKTKVCLQDLLLV